MAESYLNLQANAALYIHIPFCLSKCDYCSFNSYPVYDHEPPLYIEALKRQIDLFREKPIGRKNFETIYLGGGTPTCIKVDLLVNLLAELKKNFQLVEGAEITIEANPNSIRQEDLAQLSNAGVNRISLGIQSFSEHLLKIIGRTHTVEDIYLGVEKIRKEGFTNLSFDLIFGLPGQSLQNFKTSLEEAFNLNPQHLSLYELIVEDNTPLAAKLKSGRLTLPSEDLVAEMGEMARTICRKRGFQQYEIANFAKEGFRCRHNLHYWHNHDYLGLGAGAVSGLKGLRITNASDPHLFTRELLAGRLPVSGMEGLCRQASFRETVIMGLRMLEGISLEDLERRFGISVLNYYGKELTYLLKTETIAIKKDRLYLTEKGLPVANQILSRLV